MPAHVLLVEDDLAVAHAIERLLKANDFKVSVADTATTALEAVRTLRPDLLVLDLGLPDGDGLNVLRTLRQDGDATRVVVLSGRAPDVDSVLALEAGADDYVTKASVPAALLGRVRAALRRPAAWASDVNTPLRQFGEIEVNPATRTVRRRGIPVHLRPLEYGLLVELLAHANEVLTREQLLRRVWGYEHAVPTRTVDTHIARLRKELEADPARPRHLITVRTVGYMLRLEPPPDPSN